MLILTTLIMHGAFFPHIVIPTRRHQSYNHIQSSIEKTLCAICACGKMWQYMLLRAWVSESLIVMLKKTFIKFKPHAWNLNLTPTTLYTAKPIRFLGVDLCLRGDKTASHIDAPDVTLCVDEGWCVVVVCR